MSLAAPLPRAANRGAPGLATPAGASECGIGPVAGLARPRCPKCGNVETKKKGTYRRASGSLARQFYCPPCKFVFVDPNTLIAPRKSKSKKMSWEKIARRRVQRASKKQSKLSVLPDGYARHEAAQIFKLQKRLGVGVDQMRDLITCSESQREFLAKHFTPIIAAQAFGFRAAVLREYDRLIGRPESRDALLAEFARAVAGTQ